MGETVFSYRSKGPSVTGSSRPGGFDAFQRSVELNAAASVDPFAKASVVANASADAVTAEAHLSIEEADLQTESLPGNLTVKAGRFFGEFGRLGYIHDHELPFVNRPLVLAQYIGGESRTDGVQINWLVPIAHYVSLTAGAGNQFNSIIWGTEVLYSRNLYDEVNSDGTQFNRYVGSYGLYSYLAYKFHRQCSAGFLYGFVEDAHDNSARTSEYSAFITWSLSHWNQLRLQYTFTNHNTASGLQPDHAVYLQWAWIIGSHSHGWQER